MNRRETVTVDLMSQARISHDLGPLPRGVALKTGYNKAARLLEILRSLAVKNQKEQPRIFYSLREVARRFKVPVSTVADVYRDLEKEGFLSRVRSSRTILNGLRHNRKLSIRAFVGLPALNTNFITIQNYRTFLNCIRDELWLRGFAAKMFFFKPTELADGRLIDRFKSHEIDTVIWFFPGRTCFDTFLRLADMGIRLISISSVGTPMLHFRYYVWNNRAIEVLLRDWKNRYSVRRITVIDSKHYRSVVTEELLRMILPNLQIEYEYLTFDGEDSLKFLRNLSHIKTDGVIFPAAGLASLFTFRSPDQVIDLVRAQRVAFIDGPIDLPFVEVPDVPVDLVMVNWQAVAESIVHDLTTREAYDRHRSTTFEAEAHFRVSLKHVCEEICPTRSIGAPT